MKRFAYNRKFAIAACLIMSAIFCYALSKYSQNDSVLSLGRIPVSEVGQESIRGPETIEPESLPRQFESDAALIRIQQNTESPASDPQGFHIVDEQVVVTGFVAADGVVQKEESVGPIASVPVPETIVSVAEGMLDRVSDFEPDELLGSNVVVPSESYESNLTAPAMAATAANFAQPLSQLGEFSQPPEPERSRTDRTQASNELFRKNEQLKSARIQNPFFEAQPSQQPPQPQSNQPSYDLASQQADFELNDAAIGLRELLPEGSIQLGSSNERLAKAVNNAEAVNVAEAITPAVAFEPATPAAATEPAAIAAAAATTEPAVLVPPAAPIVPTAKDGAPSSSTQGTTDYRLAPQPKLGDRFKSETPAHDRAAHETEVYTDDFSPDPIDEHRPYDPYLNQFVYEGKQLNANQRPLLELGRPWYQLGQLSPGSSILGFHNNVNPQFLIFGDYRQAIASNTVDGDNVSQLAFELNTFWNLSLTSTERLVWGISPFDNGARNTSWLFDDDQFDFETDFDFDFGYLEGDLGAIFGGFTGKTLPFDAPFAIGQAPILIQNGIWANDALEGVFFTIPARNSPRFDISNMDISFGFVWDQIDSDAFGDDNSAAKGYLIYSFIEALNGFIEIDYAYLEDRTALDRSYHNIGLAYTRRFGRFLSHSTRVIANAGQQVSSGPQTADGVLLLLENSLITRNPYTVIPYFNFFAGFDRPQSLAGDQELVNTGILFESDGITGFPTLDGRAQDSFGGAIGLNLLAQDFSQQLILEFASVFRGEASDLAGDQYGIGMRYQLPLSNSWIFRTDATYGFFRNDSDDFGMRFEMRKKF